MVELLRDVPVPMRDGVKLFANVFKPKNIERAPVIMSVTPYGKDRMPDWLVMTLMRVTGVRFGRLECSNWTGFEAPDPIFWTASGYAVVQADVRGMHRSEGHAGFLTETDAQDYAALIEWAARQPWSIGVVGLIGVSYLAMSQWRVAALRPPALKAIVPWEGATDLLREFAYQDGVTETGFIGVWWKFRMVKGHNRHFRLAEDFPAARDAHPLDDAFWSAKRPDLERIEVPALVCASWSDHGLHTRGSLEGFERIGSHEKWLFTHGRRKWETFYGAEAKSLQRRFFDRFLKGEANDLGREPRVRLETRHTRDRYAVRALAMWPPPDVEYRRLYLDARTGMLSLSSPASEASQSYLPVGRRASRASFTIRFENAVELTGGMTLKLWVSTTEGDDLDIFVLLRKFDAVGREVYFFGYNGYAKDGVAKGWLRVSHRAQEQTLSRPGRPWHTHKSLDPVRPGDIVPIEIEVLPSSTAFEPGAGLQLDILGTDAAAYPVFRHGRSVNRGMHRVHTGGAFDSYLLAPFSRLGGGSIREKLG
jgi:predicted acyl esterase